MIYFLFAYTVINPESEKYLKKIIEIISSVCDVFKYISFQCICF